MIIALDEEEKDEITATLENGIAAFSEKAIELCCPLDENMREVYTKNGLGSLNVLLQWRQREESYKLLYAVIEIRCIDPGSDAEIDRIAKGLYTPITEFLRENLADEVYLATKCPEQVGHSHEGYVIYQWQIEIPRSATWAKLEKYFSSRPTLLQDLGINAKDYEPTVVGVRDIIKEAWKKKLGNTDTCLFDYTGFFLPLRQELTGCGEWRHKYAENRYTYDDFLSELAYRIVQVIDCCWDSTLGKMNDGNSVAVGYTYNGDITILRNRNNKDDGEEYFDIDDSTSIMTSAQIATDILHVGSEPTGSIDIMVANLTKDMIKDELRDRDDLFGFYDGVITRHLRELISSAWESLWEEDRKKRTHWRKLSCPVDED